MQQDTKQVSATGKNGKPIPPAAGKGRKSGAVNKTTKLAKEAIALAAEGLGGTERLISWAQEDPLNERAFWTSIYTKLLPLQVQAELNGKIVHGILKVPAKNG